MSRLLFLAILLSLALGRPAAADLLISIDKDSQRMTVSDGKAIFLWRVSTGGRGYATPSGSFRPSRLAAEHYSKEWDDAPMPHSIFFTDRGHAIHGTSHTRALGSPVSHGCVRLAPDNAAFLFKLVETHGLTATRIEVVGTDLEVADTYDRPARRRVDFSREMDLRPVERWLRVMEGLARR